MGSWVGSLMIHNDIAELLRQLHICTHSHQMITLLFAMCHILYVPLDFQRKAVLLLPVTFLTASMSG